MDIQEKTRHGHGNNNGNSSYLQCLFVFVHQCLHLTLQVNNFIWILEFVMLSPYYFILTNTFFHNANI
jgi:hypothetical protein